MRVLGIFLVVTTMTPLPSSIKVTTPKLQEDELFGSLLPKGGRVFWHTGLPTALELDI